MGGFNQRADRARILIADNVELFRRGLREVLLNDGRFEIAAETSELDSVPGVYAEVRPDIALITVGDEDAARRSNVTSAIHSIFQIDRGARIILLISSDVEEQVVGFIRLGAQGVLLRDASAVAILGALHDVYAGGAALDGRLANGLFRTVAAGSRAGAFAGSAGLAPAVLSLLSQRERDVLQALARGNRNKQIGAELGVSVGTVKTHLRHIFRKLQVSDRTAAVLVALDARLRKAA
jgi:DNA-binding NarL/FixJ family response regulator